MMVSEWVAGTWALSSASNEALLHRSLICTNYRYDVYASSMLSNGARVSEPTCHMWDAKAKCSLVSVSSTAQDSLGSVLCIVVVLYTCTCMQPSQ